MNVDVVLQLGLRGRSRRIGSMALDAVAIGNASSWSGAYQIRQMGRHYDDYVVTGYTAMLPPLAGIPPSHPYEQLTGKVRATGVIANVGESVAALFVRRVLNLAVRDIIHIRARQPFQRRKAPDYLMRLNPGMPGVFGSVTPKTDWKRTPKLWPVEAKARTTESGAQDARRTALEQLIGFWALMRATKPGEVGYGMTVSFTYLPPREVRVQLFLPKDVHALGQFLASNEGALNRANVGPFLHGC